MKDELAYAASKGKSLTGHELARELLKLPDLHLRTPSEYSDGSFEQIWVSEYEITIL